MIRRWPRRPCARVALGLSACGGIVGAGNAGNVETAQNGPVEGELVISNWPGYVDPGKDNSLAQFTDRTGVEIEYIEDINDNAAFFGKVQPLLDQGESGDRSIMVVTDWMAKQMYDLGYLQEVDHDDLPTVFENIRPGIRSSELDPDRKYAIPWQSGMTGIWVDTAQAPDITSINDLFDPKYKGRVTMLTEMRDTVPLVMKADGVDPSHGDHRGVDGRGRQDPSGGRRRADPALHRERLHGGHHERKRRGLDRMVRRRLPDLKPRRRVADARRRLQ